VKEKLSLIKRSPKLCVVLAGGVSSSTGLIQFFDTKPPEEINRQIIVVGKADQLSGTTRFFDTHPVFYTLNDIVVIRGQNTSFYATLWANTPISVELKSHYPKSFGVEKAIGDIVKRCTRIDELVRVIGEIDYCDVGDDEKKLRGLVKNRICYYKRGVV